jgi:DNA-binding transcriptional ArsR family regulator
MADLLKSKATWFRDLGHPVRLRILCILARETRQCVCRMLPELGVPQPTLSRHLAILRTDGLIEDQREGTMVFYRIADETVLDVLRAAGLPCAAGGRESCSCQQEKGA